MITLTHSQLLPASLSSPSQFLLGTCRLSRSSCSLSTNRVVRCLDPFTLAAAHDFSYHRSYLPSTAPPEKATYQLFGTSGIELRSSKEQHQTLHGVVLLMDIWINGQQMYVKLVATCEQWTWTTRYSLRRWMWTMET